MYEQLEQNKHSEQQVMTPMLDHILPPPTPLSDLPAVEVGVDQNDQEAGRRAELGSVRAMILRLASDMVTVSVFHDLGHVDEASYEQMREQYVNKVAFQFDSVDLQVEGMIKADEGEERFDANQLANEAFDAVYHEVKQKVLKEERDKTLDYVDILNQELEPYGRIDVTVDKMLSTAPTEVASRQDQPLRAERELEPAITDKTEVHTGLARRVIQLVSHHS
ncbi:MAG TPA: hypothetical protein VF281_01875 [Candidatus Saccharimonadales bacterium]